MQDSFNPYHEWLGLEMDQREPDYYQLLGIGSETRDAAEIAAAANRAITRVRSHRPGPRAAAWARLLDQLGEAKRCLSDPSSRVQYDAHLGRGTSSPAPVASPRGTQETLDYIAPVPQAPAGLYPPVPRSDHGDRSDRGDRWASPPASAVPASVPALVTPPAAAAPLPAHDPMAPYDPDAPATAAPGIWSEPQVPVGTAWNVPSEARSAVEPSCDAAYSASAAPAAWPAAAPYESAYPPGEDSVGAWPQGPGPAGSPPVGSVPMGSVPMGSVPMGSVPMGSVPMGSVPMGTPVGSTWADQSPSDPTVSDSVAPSAAKKPVRARRSQSSSLGFMALGAVSLAVLLGVLYLAARNRWSAVPVATGPGTTGPAAGSAAGVGTTKPVAGNWPSGTGAGSSTSPRADRPMTTQPGSVIPPASERQERMPPDADGPQPDTFPTVPVADPGTSPPAMNDPALPAVEPPTIGPPAVSPSPDPSMPKPAEPPATAQPPLTTAQLAELGRALSTARVALGEQSFDVAQEELAKAAQLARQPDHVAKVERLKLLAQYVEGFWDAVSQAVAGLEGTDEFTVGSTVVVVVEATPERLVIKANGVRREYPVRQLPPGLAVAIADQWFDKTKPENLVFKGAYVAVMRNAKEDDLAKGRGWWQQAQAAGIDLADLLPVLEDTYEFTAGADDPM